MEKKKTFQKPEMSVAELQRALYEANCKLLESERQRTEVFANISHDLRSPLAAITSTIEYLRSYDDIDAEELQDMLEVMSKKAEQLSELINNIFFLTQSDYHKNPVQLTSTDFTPYLSDIIASYQKDSSYENRLIQFVNEAAQPVFAEIDSGQFRRVLDNLMNNAKKFTAPDGTIVIRLSVIDSSIHLSVHDNGIGIDSSLTEKIFERTFTVSDSRTPGKEGCGLGLSIARTIIEEHHGSLSCTSEIKKGSTFLIVLPLVTD